MKKEGVNPNDDQEKVKTSEEVLAALQAELAEAKAAKEAAENTLKLNNIDLPAQAISGTHTVAGVAEDHPYHGKKIRFKVGHNYFRLPYGVMERLSKGKDAEYLAKLADPGGVTHAINAIEMPEVMEALVELGSGIIEVTE